MRLNGRERIRHVFDLRPHARSQEVKVLTRDGIPLDTTISVSFQIRQNEHFKPDRHAVFLLSYTGSRGEAADEIPWTERIAPLAAASLVTQLSTMTLDELYTAEDRPAPLEELVASVRRDVYLKLSHIFDYAETDDAGPIEIKSISLGLLRPPDDVLDQRIRNWRMTWESHIYREQASGSAEALRRINLARARAQLDLLQNIVENIDTMRRAGHDNLSEVVRLRMLEAMESALRDGQVRAFVPQQVLSTLQDIQEMIDPQGKRE